jgi:hypothetical protein
MYYALPLPGGILTKPTRRPGLVALPHAAVALTEAQYRQLLDVPGSLAWISGAVVPTPPPDPVAVYVAQLALINAAYQDALADVRNGYPPDEILTWDKQEREARAHLVDPAAATPFLDYLAAERGIDKADLVGRIMTKVEAAEATIGKLTGKRQRLEDQLDAILAAHRSGAPAGRGGGRTNATGGVVVATPSARR